MSACGAPLLAQTPICTHTDTSLTRRCLLHGAVWLGLGLGCRVPHVLLTVGKGRILQPGILKHLQLKKEEKIPILQH